mmetsp:Transcript_4931/g.12387  ORF Transcript_4931/g.12387 Transcript_4931/m.12387 type:complete len:681 (+) Transcript_4931:111-2153(+)
MRSYYCYSTCLLALASPITRAEIPMRENGMSSNGATVSQQFTKVASAAKSSSNKSSSSIRNIFSSHLPAHRTAVASSTATKTNGVEDECEQPSSSDPPHDVQQSQPPPPPSSSISVGAGTGGGILSLIQNIVLPHSATSILRCATFCAQLVLAGYLAKSSWKFLREIVEELNEEFGAFALHGGGGGGDGGDVREEQDMPYADDGALRGLGGGRDAEEEGDESDDNRSSGRRREKKSKIDEGSFTPQMTATRELAARLRSSGIPYAKELSEEDVDDGIGYCVENIVRSLNRAEGNVLSQTLLTPSDDGGLAEGDGSTAPPHTAATAAWNAIGGLSDAKESLIDLAFPLLPTTQSDSERNDYYGGLLANPPGVLLYGPPGCGKSMLVRALAATVGARFLVVSPSCLLRKYVGETNLNVRALFSVARKISPCVIFVDELDGLFRERGGEDHDVGRDLKTEFLQLWDGIRHHAQRGGDVGSSSVLVIGATNRPFDVDPAFLRRMPRKVFVNLPNYDSRISVLQSMLDKVPLDQDFDLELVASRTGGYSPSDIREVLQTAALYPLREARAEAMSSSQIDGRSDGENGSVPIRMQMPPLRNLRTDDVIRALQGAKPTHFSRRYQRELMKYVSNSGGSQINDSNTSPSVTTREADDFSANYFDDGDADESDSYSYDDDTSDSDYDNL